MKARLFALGAAALVVAVAVGCSSSRNVDEGAPDASVPSPVSPATPENVRPKAAPNYVAGPADSSRSVVAHGPRVDVAYPHASPPLRDLPDAVPVQDRFEHEPGKNPLVFPVHDGPDPVLQARLPVVEMPMTLRSFLAQGATLGNCSFPAPDGGEPAGCTTRGDPPDTVGAVGLNHYVQIVNSGIGVWKKDGTILQNPKFTSALFTNHPTGDGNHCGAAPPNGDWGDGVVLYDQMADRWMVTQFDLTNYVTSNTGPSYQCVAVSQTGDPTGAWWTYDFQYSAAINDYGKFSVWPDAYYASFNLFNPGFTSAELCAYDRASMLKGATATQQCFTNSAFGFLPANVDGAIKPPNGEPAFFVTLSPFFAIDLYKLHVDWTTPGNSTFTGPTSLAVGGYTELCGGGNCVTQPSPGNALASLGDRPMFHLSYRNFGTLESLMFNHSVSAGTAGGIRWYEIQSPNGTTPVVAQQGTYAPGDGKYRWMGSLSQDQAQDIALGFSVSGASTFPTIAWTGHTPADPGGTMGQAETIVQAGAGVETGNFSNGQAAARWGDYSNMTVDPTDDCTFWYTQEIFPANGIFNWDTHVSSVKFPNCALNDFTIGVAPPVQNLPQNGKVTYTVTTTSTVTAEQIALTIQDLPAGVTGAFVPSTITAGSTSTLTLSATLVAPLTASPDTFMVIGKATSAVHAATAQVNVTACAKISSCPAPDDCGTISDGCGGTVTCGGVCVASDACHTAGVCSGNVCTNPVAQNGTTCNDGNACTTGDVCTNGTCAGAPVVCTNGDQCNSPGTCQAGACSAPTPKGNGTTCTDNDACTTGDVCNSGACAGTPVVCTNGDACHDPGTCQVDGGTCSAPTEKVNGSTCTGTDMCNQSYTCQSGACTGGNPVVCTAEDECHDVGPCGSSTGMCTNPPKPDGTPCSVGACMGGTCTRSSGTDAGMGADASMPIGDSGTAHHDAATPHDSGATADAASGGATGQGGGCGCRVAEPSESSPLRIAGFGVPFALALLRRRRRARRDGVTCS